MGVFEVVHSVVTTFPMTHQTNLYYRYESGMIHKLRQTIARVVHGNAKSKSTTTDHDDFSLDMDLHHRVLQAGNVI